MEGRIHSIVSYSVVDGPGSRYVVFMQGCNNRCKFCHNPDTFKMSGGELIDEDDLLKRILNAKKYINGGVTFSGGEPLLQAKFLLSICRKLKENNIHVALDTAGNFDINEDLKELLNIVDLVMIDIKSINNDQHKWLVGTYNDKIINFIKYLDKNNIKMWIRIVYMPTITDKYTDDLKKFIDTLNKENIDKIDILKYHKMGIYKWKELGLKYELEDINEPTDDEINEFRNKLEGNL